MNTLVTRNSLKGKKVLITCGPTWIPIDEVRVLSNTSSGELGHTLANQLEGQRAKVTLIEGPVTHAFQNKRVKVIKFLFFEELKKALRLELKKKPDIVIHAAAVSDYQLKKPSKGKIGSSQSKLQLNLIPTPKIINEVKRIHPKAFLVGFKLEPDLKVKGLPSKIRRLFLDAGCDLLIINTIDKNKYCGYIINFDNKILGHAKTRKQMADSLIRALKNYS